VLRCICSLFAATAQVLSEWNVFAAFLNKFIYLNHFI
jgi:hypothetical protein